MKGNTLMFDVLCVGLMVGDIIVSPVGKHIMEADTCPIERIGYFTGGDALNTAVALSRLGKKVKAAGVVGTDPMGNLIMENARKECVDMGGVTMREDVPTSTSVILTEQNGERHIAYFGGSNELFTQDMVADADIMAARVVHVGSAMELPALDGDGLARLFERAKGMGRLTSFDCSFDKEGVWLAKIEKALHFTDIFIPSYDEAVAITGQTEPREMARFLEGYGLRVFGVKLGAKGAWLTDFANEYRLGIFPADPVVDTTGAGDCFMAGFLSVYPEGGDVREAGIFAAATSKFCVEAAGAVTNIPSMETVRRYIAGSYCECEVRSY